MIFRIPLFIVFLTANSYSVEIGLAWDSVCKDINGNDIDVSYYVLEAYDQQGQLISVEVQDELDPQKCAIKTQTVIDIPIDPTDLYKFAVRAVGINGIESEKTVLEIDGKCLGFSRHDINKDGRENLLDVLSLIHFLFHQRPIFCWDVGLDLNDDGELDISDVVTWLNEVYKI